MKASLLAVLVLLAVSFSTVRSSDITCGVCTYLVSAAEGYIANNATETEILGYLEKDCDLLVVQSWVTVCKGTVSTFGPEIINLVLQKQPAATVCAEVGLCNSSSISLPKVKPNSNSPIIVSPVKLGNGSALECSLCKFLVKEIEDLLAANKTETEIIAALTDVCIDFPIKDWQDTCKNIVEEYGVLIIKYVENEPSDAVCHLIGLCPTPTTTTSSSAPSMKLQ